MKKIYFGLWRTLGDVIVSTALIRAIKTKYPESEITYAVGEEYIPVLENNPDITDVIPCKNPYEIVLRSKEKEYDKILLPLMLNQEDTLWHQRDPWCIDNGDNHNLIDMYALKCEEDLVIEDRREFLYPTDDSWEEILETAGDKKEDFENTPFITVHTTSSNPSKDWSYDRFVEVTKKIAETYGDKFRIYQIGGEKDKPLPEPVKNLCGLPLKHTMAIIKRSKFHLDGDSGPSFMADALNVPTVCIMGATWSQTSGPIGPNVTFIEPERHCLERIHTPCHTQCPIAPQCIDSVSVDTVYEEVTEKLNGIFTKEPDTGS